jgi:hypothetical protein
MGFIPTHVYTGCVYIKRSYYLSPMPKRSTRVVVYSVCVVGAEIPLMAPRLTWDRSTTYHTQTALRHGKSRASEHWARLTTAFPPRLIRDNPPPPLTDICFYIQGSLRYTVPIKAFRHFFKRVIVEYTVLASERSPNH